MLLRLALVTLLITTLALIAFYLYSHDEQQAINRARLVLPQRPWNIECISLPYRDNQFQHVRKQALKQNLDIHKFPAVQGKLLDLDQFSDQQLHPKLRKWLIKRPDHMGHWGATLSHLGVYQKMVQDQQGLTMILEDDVTLCPNFATEVQHHLDKVEQLDPQWDLLLLGFSCDYAADRKLCSCNDGRKLQKDTLLPIGYFIGMWAYMVRDHHTAAKILQQLPPMQSFIDHDMNRLGRKGALKIYGCVPHLAFHPGTIRVSSLGYQHRQPYFGHVSDTNG